MDFDLDGSAWIALASLLVSFWTLWRQRRAAGRANLTVEWESAGELLIINHGPGAARDLRAHVGDGADDAHNFPFTGPFQTVRVHYDRMYGTALPTIRLSWRDNRISRQGEELTAGSPPRKRSHPQPRSNIEKALRDLAREEVRAEIQQELKRAPRRRI